MTTAGPNLAGTGADDSAFGSATWSSPGNITASDNTRATCNVLTTSHYLKATNFGFAIPAGSVIDGIEVRFERNYTVSAITDSRVRIVKGGAISTTDLSAGATWTASTDTLNTFGGATSLWGETWTADDINASTFGVVLACAGSGGFANVDSVDITIHYTPLSGCSPFGNMGFFGV